MRVYSGDIQSIQLYVARHYRFLYDPITGTTITEKRSTVLNLSSP